MVNISEQDFNKLKDISKELNDIRLRNKINKIELLVGKREAYERNINEVAMIIRGDDFYKDCKIGTLRWEDNCFKDIEYKDFMK